MAQLVLRVSRMFYRRGDCLFNKIWLLTSKFSVVKFLLEFVVHWLCNLFEGMHKNPFTGLLLNFLICVQQRVLFSSSVYAVLDLWSGFELLRKEIENEFLRCEPVTSDPKAGVVPRDHDSNSMCFSKFVYVNLKQTSKHQITQLLMHISFALTSIIFPKHLLF